MDANACVVADLHDLVVSGRRFGAIYADPPWRYRKRVGRGAAERHYPTMTMDEIAALPVAQLAAPQAHLWLWTTNGFLFECPRLFAAWGFEFKSSYVWCKRQMGIGNYLRNAHEIMLLGVKGGPPFANNTVSSWFVADRRRHSEKPEEMRRIVERASPGPRLELFARKTSPGWTVWGNEVARGREEGVMTMELQDQVKPTVKIGKQTFTILFPDLLPPLSERDLVKLRKSIRQNGVEVPVVVDEQDGVIDGGNRVNIAAECGLVKVPVDVRRGLSPESKMELAYSLNENRRHMDAATIKKLKEERVARVAEAKIEGQSNRAIAEKEGGQRIPGARRPARSNCAGVRSRPAGWQGQGQGRQGATGEEGAPAEDKEATPSGDGRSV